LVPFAWGHSLNGPTLAPTFTPPYAGSCGIYHYPLDDAAEVALEAVRAHAGSLEEVHFVLFGEDTFSAWEKAARAMNLVEEIMTD